MFLWGAACHIHRDRLRLSWDGALIATVGLIVGLMSSPSAHVGTAIFGGYLLLAGARAGGGTAFARINAKTDISYGVYLYAWPIEKLLLWFGFSAGVWLTGLTTLALALLAGWVSWHLVEAPVLRWATQNLGRSSRRRSDRALLG